ncbi:hypothetical protein ACFVUQ_27110 [Streptomyces cyaneofuscatus]|uniref:hypothetical protein n=1 Tax=Streptomyces cyaneofuscatus TaxID=66883 RepID=UPI0036DB66EA
MGDRQADLLYTVACGIREPAHFSGLVEEVRTQFGLRVEDASARSALSNDRRFCWAGFGRYALYRHGPLPGPRTLVDTVRLTLLLAGRPLGVEALDLWLRRKGYQYNVGSLRNAVRRDAYVRCRPDGRLVVRLPWTKAVELLRTDCEVRTAADYLWMLRAVVGHDIAGFFAQSELASGGTLQQLTRLDWGTSADANLQMSFGQPCANRGTGDNPKYPDPPLTGRTQRRHR